MAPTPAYDDTFVRNQSEGYFSQDDPNTLLYTAEEDSDTSSQEQQRVFVNECLDLAQIKCFGFDMDYTLAEYISPEFDQLGCRLTQQWMVDHLGYDQQILDIQYDPNFPIRYLASASKRSIRRFVITEKAPTRAFSWLKAVVAAFSQEKALVGWTFLKH